MKVARLRVALQIGSTICCGHDFGRNPQPATFIGIRFFDVCIFSILYILYMYIYLYSIIYIIYNIIKNKKRDPTHRVAPIERKNVARQKLRVAFWTEIAATVCCRQDFGRNPQLATRNSGCAFIPKVLKDTSTFYMKRRIVFRKTMRRFPGNR